MLSLFSVSFMEAFMMKLFAMSIMAGNIIIALIGIRFLLHRAPKIFSYGLWGIVLFRLLCPFSFSSPFSAFNLIDTTVYEMKEESESPQPEENVSKTGNPMNGIIEAKNPTQGIAGTKENSQMHDKSLPIEEQILFVLSGIWIVGVIVLISVNMATLWKLRKKTATSLQIQGNVFLCDEVDTPFCVGILKPRIYLPSFLEERERAYIILHEKHHIKRLDHITKLLAFFALCLHWFNPLVWMAFILAGKDMEMSCDEAVMKKMDEDIRAKYSTSLLKLATGKRAFVTTGLSFGEGNPKQRIKNVMSYKKPTFWMAFLAIIACIVTTIIFVTNPLEKKNNGSEFTENTEKGNEKESTEEGQSCFQNILQQREEGENWYKERDNGLNMYDMDIYDSVCRIKWIKLRDKEIIENLSFDLTDYMEKAACTHAVMQGIFYGAKEDIIYVPICSFEPLEDLEYEWLLEFPVKAPEQYKVTEYPGEYHALWFGSCYLIQNILCWSGGSDTAPWVLNLKTKEMHQCKKEYENTKQFVQDWIASNKPEWDSLQVWWFYPRDIKDNVIIYEGDISEAMDTEALMTIYVAYEEDRLIQTMLIDETTGETIVLD